MMRGRKPTPWVCGHVQVMLSASPASVLDAIRIIVAMNPIYRNAHEDTDHTVFEMTVNIPWSLLGLPMRVTVADQGRQTLVKVAVTSQWWRMTDVGGTRDRRIRDFITALKQQVAQGTT